MKNLAILPYLALFHTVNPVINNNYSLTQWEGWARLSLHSFSILVKMDNKQTRRSSSTYKRALYFTVKVENDDLQR